MNVARDAISFENFGQETFSIFQRTLAKIIPIEVQQIEGPVFQTVGAALLKRILQCLEVASAVGPQRDNLSVHDRLRNGQIFCRFGKGSQPIGPILVIAAKEVYLPLVDPANDSIAVEF